VPRFATLESETPEQKKPTRINPVATAGVLFEKTIDTEVAAILVSAPAISSELDRDPRKWPTQIPKATALESANSGLDENRTRRDSPGFSAFVRITFMRVNLSKAHTPSTHFHCKFFATRNSNG